MSTDQELTEARAMFISRLLNMGENGIEWVTVREVLDLHADCDYLAFRDLSHQEFIVTTT